MQSELTLEEIAHAVAMQQLNADRLREVARDATRRAPVKIEEQSVFDAVDLGRSSPPPAAVTIHAKRI